MLLTSLLQIISFFWVPELYVCYISIFDCLTDISNSTNSKVNTSSSDLPDLNSAPSHVPYLGECHHYLHGFPSQKLGQHFIIFFQKHGFYLRIILFLTFNTQLITKSCWFYLIDLFRTYPLSSTPTFISLLSLFTLCFLHLELPFLCFSLTGSLYF